MNELFFLLHIIFVISFTFVALIIGEQALIATICLQAVLANLFVLKQVALFGLNVTCSDVFIVGGILGLNLLQEYYGQEIAKKTIWISFFILIFYLVMVQFHLLYLPNLYDTVATKFDSILKFTPRLIVSSVFVYLLVQRIDCSFYAFLKSKFKNRYFISRNIFSVLVAQLIDTVLFSLIALYGIIGSIFDVIVASFIIKVIIIFASAPFISFSKRLVKYKL